MKPNQNMKKKENANLPDRAISVRAQASAAVLCANALASLAIRKSRHACI